MPELPEVEVVKRSLVNKIQNSISIANNCDFGIAKIGHIPINRLQI